MQLSSVYVCPVRGLVHLDPPEPDRLLKAAGAARDIGVERLLLPVLEESLLQGTKSKVRFLDGLILALDQVAEARLQGSLIAPASNLLGLSWAPPFLVKGYRDPKAPPVFVDGGLRHLHPLDWWGDPAVIGQRIRLFRELLCAVAGHPALTGWVLLDRAFDPLRPAPEAADFVLRSFVAEVRARDGKSPIQLGLEWSELIAPQTALAVAPLVDGIRMAGGERGVAGLPSPDRLSEELKTSAFLSAVALWLLEKPLEVQCGGGGMGGTGDPDEASEHLVNLGRQGARSLCWWTLVDPEPARRKEIPWALRPGLDRTGLFGPDLEPARGAEAWLRAARAAEPGRGKTGDFVDIGREEYLSDPPMHLVRLWGHFLDSL